jgi:phage terminase large subunit
MTTKLSYEDFKNQYIAKIPYETISQIEKLRYIKDLTKKIIEEEILNQYNNYLNESIEEKK